MGHMNRRLFIKHGTSAGIGAAALGFSGRRVWSATNGQGANINYRELGSTGFKASEIGFGAMNTRDAELIHAAIDSGINYIDTAHAYMRGVNEQIVGEVMQTKRDKVFLTTKLRVRDASETEEMMATSLKRLMVDHVDLVLLHVVDTRELTLDEDIIESFVKIRDKGMTRFIGVSTHANQAEVMDAAVESGVWEAVLTGYNYQSPKEVGEAIKRTREAGLATIGMKNLITTARPRKPFPDIRGENQKNITNQQALLAWVLENKYLDTTIPGMTSFEHLADDIAVMGIKLGHNGNKTIRRYSMGTAGEYCSGVSGCTGCREKCPKGVAINEINRCINYADGYGSLELARENYDHLPESSRVDLCSDCDECVVTCINGLNLPSRIQRARELFA